jgi:hypothetical protein
VLFRLSLLLAIITTGCNGGPGAGPLPPTTNNALPVVTSIVVKGSAPREPAQYATLGETVNVAATVTDAETPVAQLTYEWTSNAGGSFGPPAATTTWTAPGSTANATPLNVTLTLTVTERFGTNQTNRVTATSIVNLHNSPKEVGDLAVLFLEEFSRQLPVDAVMRNFSANCPTAADERQDVINQQNAVSVISHSIGAPSTNVPFTGVCPFRSRMGDACSAIPVSWVSSNKSSGEISRSSGTDYVTAVLESNQWRLCASDYEERNFFGESLTRFWIQR